MSFFSSAFPLAPSQDILFTLLIMLAIMAWGYVAGAHRQTSRGQPASYSLLCGALAALALGMSLCYRPDLFFTLYLVLIGYYFVVHALVFWPPLRPWRNLLATLLGVFYMLLAWWMGYWVLNMPR